MRGASPARSQTLVLIYIYRLPPNNYRCALWFEIGKRLITDQQYDLFNSCGLVIFFLDTASRIRSLANFVRTQVISTSCGVRLRLAVIFCSQTNKKTEDHNKGRSDLAALILDQILAVYVCFAKVTTSLVRVYKPPAIRNVYSVTICLGTILRL